MNSSTYLRKLAKIKENVNLFAAARDIASIQMFRNTADLTFNQQLYLSYLYFYFTLYSDVAAGKVSERVMDNDEYEDAYFVWKHRKDKVRNRKKPMKKGRKKKFQGVFISPKDVKGLHKEVKK